MVRPTRMVNKKARAIVLDMTLVAHYRPAHTELLYVDSAGAGCIMGCIVVRGRVFLRGPD